jgi:hypothetical protein
MSSAGNEVGDDVAIHRIGGGSVENLALKPTEEDLDPPGISVFHGGRPGEAAAAMRRHFPRMARRGKAVVGSTIALKVRAAGFNVIMNPTPRFPQHARLIHPAGVAGFTRENLERLAKCFDNQEGL